MGYVVIPKAAAVPLAVQARAVDKDDFAAAKLHFQLGLNYYKNGKLKDAIREFQRAYDLTQRPKPLLNIGICYFDLKEWSQAITHLERYLKTEQNPNDPYIERANYYIWVARHQLGGKEKSSGETPRTVIYQENEPLPEKEGRAEESDRFWQWISFGTAGALLTASGVNYFLAGWQRDKHEERVEALIREGHILNQGGRLWFADFKSQAAYQGELDTIDHKKKLLEGVAIGTLIGGVLAAGAGGFLVWRDAAGNAVSLKASGGTQTGLQLQIEFH